MQRGSTVENVSVDRKQRVVCSMFSVQCCVLCSSETNLLQGGGEKKEKEISECSDVGSYHCSQESRAVRVGTCLGKLRIWEGAKQPVQLWVVTSTSGGAKILRPLFSFLFSRHPSRSQ